VNFPPPGSAEIVRESPWQLNEIVWRRRLREAAQRPLAINLAEGLALSEFLSSFHGSARRARDAERASTRPRDRDDVEALEAAQDESPDEPGPT